MTSGKLALVQRLVGAPLVTILPVADRRSVA
jgi:hypothetical protein